MGIKRFFNHTVVVRRLRTISGNLKSLQATATADGAIQEMDREARSAQGILEEKAWRAWFDEDTDINEGDEITDDNGVVYHVREVVAKDYGINRHLQVLLVELNA